MFGQLKKFMMAPGVSGDEGGIAAVIAKDIAPYVDSVDIDTMGNVIAFKKGHGEHPKKLMFAAYSPSKRAFTSSGSSSRPLI